MGKQDNALYHYLEDNRRFADLFNGAVFQGKMVVSGSMLESDDGRYVEFEGNEDKAKHGTKSRYRDLKKRLKCGGWLAIVAVENQETVDFTMPLRMMEYDCLEYRRQVRRIQRDNVGEQQGRKLCRWDTRLQENNKLQPVHSLCFYHGMKEWTGPKSLRNMMNFEGAPPGWEALFHDYGMSLFCANQIEDFSVFKTELRNLLEVIPCRKDKRKLVSLARRDEYKHLDKDTAEVIAVLTNNNRMLEHLDEYENENGGGYNMCQALEDLVAEGREEGREEGRTELLTLLDILAEKLTADGEMDKIPQLFQLPFLEETRQRYGL